MNRKQTTLGITLILMLVLAVGQAEARQRRLRGHIAGTSVNGTIDTNGDGIAMDVALMDVALEVANTNLGRFINQGGTEVKNPNAPNSPSACQLPDGTVGFEFGLVQGHGVSTHERTGDQLFADETSFTECLNFSTGKFSFSAAGTWAGGTGQFANATGPWSLQGTGAVVVADPSGHFLSQFTYDAEGTIITPGD